MLRLLIDESTGRKVARALAESGFDVLYVADVMRGAGDEKILQFAEQEKRILVTNDKDFGELVFRLMKPVTGVIFLRLASDVPQKRIEVLSKVIQNFQGKFIGHFIVANEYKIRVRKIE